MWLAVISKNFWHSLDHFNSNAKWWKSKFLMGQIPMRSYENNEIWQNKKICSLILVCLQLAPTDANSWRANIIRTRLLQGNLRSEWKWACWKHPARVPVSIGFSDFNVTCCIFPGIVPACCETNSIMYLTSLSKMYVFKSNVSETGKRKVV